MAITTIEHIIEYMEITTSHHEEWSNFGVRLTHFFWFAGPKGPTGPKGWGLGRTSIMATSLKRSISGSLDWTWLGHFERNAVALTLRELSEYKEVWVLSTTLSFYINSFSTAQLTNSSDTALGTWRIGSHSSWDPSSMMRLPITSVAGSNSLFVESFPGHDCGEADV